MVYVAESPVAVINEALRLGRHLSRTKPALGEQVISLARRAFQQRQECPYGIPLAMEALRLGGGDIPSNLTAGLSRAQRVRWRIYCSHNQPAVEHPATVAELHDDGVGVPIEDALDFLLEPPTQSTDDWDFLED